MEIKNFEELTSFIYSEYDKLRNSFEVIQPSSDFICFVENKFSKYILLYDKPFCFREKKEMKLFMLKTKKEYKIKMAIESMPHGVIWKFFNRSLWKQVLEKIEEDKKKTSVNDNNFNGSNNVNCETNVPEIVKNYPLE